MVKDIAEEVDKGMLPMCIVQFRVNLQSKFK